MINKNMFYGEPTINDYRDIDPREIIREYLLTKGTWCRTSIKDESPKPIHKEVHPKDLVNSGLFVYGLKDNPTNRRAIEYYCERWGHIHQIIDGHHLISIPSDLWEECDEYNKIHCKVHP